MKTITRSILFSMLMIFAASAYAESGLQAIQIFECEFEDDGTADKLLAASSAWLKVARTAKGGENLNVAIRYPIAEGGEGASDFKFVITMPTFTEWGMFTDGYEDSAVKAADANFEGIASCSSSTMWEGIRVN